MKKVVIDGKEIELIPANYRISSYSLKNNCALNGIKSKIVGWEHSDKLDGKYTKAQRRFLKVEGNKIYYAGKKRFIKPIVVLSL